MQCQECSREMKISPYMLMSNPPLEEYKCGCGHVEYVRLGEHSHATVWDTDKLDEPFFKGYKSINAFLRKENEE